MDLTRMDELRTPATFTITDPAENYYDDWGNLSPNFEFDIHHLGDAPHISKVVNFNKGPGTTIGTGNNYDAASAMRY
jgi:hypothetical protein